MPAAPAAPAAVAAPAAPQPASPAGTNDVVDDDAEMVLHEERLKVGVQRRERGRARLVKRISSETQTVTVPVSHEKVTVTSEPLTGAQAKASAGPLTEDVREVVLTEQVPVVAKEVVAVEQVHMDKRTVADEVTVTETLRKERVEVDTDLPPTTRRR